MSIIDKVFLDKIERPRLGRYAFRGQANAKWKLYSAATRRLISEQIIQPSGTGATGNDQFPRIYKSYHGDELIAPARTAGFDIEEGRVVSDLQLLAKLQHFGAATGLIDFTWPPLIALWFACAEQRDRDGELVDGTVFVVNLNDTDKYQRVFNDQRVFNGEEAIDKLFPPNDGRVLPLYWEPKVRSEASARILRQQSVFVLVRSLGLEDVVQKIKIEASDKEDIKKELAGLGISELSLFMDIHGFSMVNGPDAPVRQMNDPDVYLIQGNTFYQQGDYNDAIKSYDKCISIAQDSHEAYYLRGNAKAETRDYEGAIKDYDSAAEKGAIAFDRWAILFNRGNAKVALDKYEDALRDYDKAVQLAQKLHLESSTGMIVYNRANTKTILGKYEDAIQDYDEAIRLRPESRKNARFNKGNVLVITGRFPEALQCYGESIREGYSKAERNIKSLEGVLQSIGEAEYKCPQHGSTGPVSVVITVNDGSRVPRVFGFDGSVGNTGNRGGNRLPGGEGYSGGHPFVVEVRAGNLPSSPGQTVL